MKKYLLVGLGNPGPKFQHTRHNLGARAVEAWQTAQPELAAMVAIYQPIVFMNDSGPAVAQLLKKEGVPSTGLIIVHDEVELPFGQIKVKAGGSAAGHNGVRSIQDTLGTQDMQRLRLGVGRPTTEMELSDYVLTRFSQSEEDAMPDFLARASEALTAIISYPDPE